MNIVLGFSLMLLRDRKGDGKEGKRGRIVSVVKGESIVSVATMEERWKGRDKSQHNGGSFALYSIHSSMRE